MRREPVHTEQFKGQTIDIYKAGGPTDHDVFVSGALIDRASSVDAGIVKGRAWAMSHTTPLSELRTELAAANERIAALEAELREGRLLLMELHRYEDLNEDYEADALIEAPGNPGPLNEVRRALLEWALRGEV